MGSPPRQSFAPGDIVHRHPDILGAEVDGAMVLMSAARGHYYGLDRIASDVWRRIEQPVPIGTLIASLAGAYHGDPVRIAADVEELLHMIRDQGLVEIIAEGR